MVSVPYAKLLNSNQVLLRKMLSENQDIEQIRPLLLQQHARLHSRDLLTGVDWSYQDAVLADLPDDWMRIVPEGEEHSIAWLLWHLTRCEDITMNLLVLETDQVLFSQAWFEKLNCLWRDTGNAMSPEEIFNFSQIINLDALLNYRTAVGQNTQNIINGLTQESLHRKMNADAVQRIFDEGAVLEEARGIAEYWSKRDVAGLLLMPATRHILTHLNEALKIKKRLKKALSK
ncbi:MAG TPA: DinB family protein [Brevefilum sp.]